MPTARITMPRWTTMPPVLGAKNAECHFERRLADTNAPRSVRSAAPAAPTARKQATSSAGRRTCKSTSSTTVARATQAVTRTRSHSTWAWALRQLTSGATAISASSSTLSGAAIEAK